MPRNHPKAKTIFSVVDVLYNGAGLHVPLPSAVFIFFFFLLRSHGLWFCSLPKGGHYNGHIAALLNIASRQNLWPHDDVTNVAMPSYGDITT